jgi:hypothetical protein
MCVISNDKSNFNPCGRNSMELDEEKKNLGDMDGLGALLASILKNCFPK